MALSSMTTVRHTQESATVASSLQYDVDCISPNPPRKADASSFEMSRPAAQESTAEGVETERPVVLTGCTEGQSGGTKSRGAGLWSKLRMNLGSVELENKASVARDHLALERTFLAWLRTSLSLASIGIAITQLFRLNTSLQFKPNSDATINSTAVQTYSSHALQSLGKPIGASFIAISIFVLFLGFHRYFEAQHYVIRGKFPASRGSVIGASLVVGALIVGSLAAVLAAGAAFVEN